MRSLAALMVALPLAAAAQAAPPPSPAQPSPPGTATAQPAQPSPPPPAPPGYAPPPPGVYPPGYPPGAYPPGQPWPGPRRDPWYIGFGIGSGGGTFTVDGTDYRLSDGMSSPATVFLNFKAGVTLTPTLLLGLDLAGHLTSGTTTIIGSTYDASRQLTNVDLMITWFPVERGFFLRGGLGASNFREEVTNLYTDDLDGANVTVGAGYAFWLGRTFNLTVNLDYSAQTYRSNRIGAPTRSNYAALWLGFDWY